MLEVAQAVQYDRPLVSLHEEMVRRQLEEEERQTRREEREREEQRRREEEEEVRGGRKKVDIERQSSISGEGKNLLKTPDYSPWFSAKT